MAAGAVIVVAHNSAECIESCLEGLKKNSGWQIVLIDNASTDQTLVKAKSVDLAISILSNSQNYGFGGAVNQAAKLVQSDILIILNPDAVADPGSLNEMARALAPEGIGAVGGLLLDSEREPEKGFTIRRFPTLGSALLEVLLLNRLWPRNPWNRNYRCLDLDYTQAQEIEQPAGACLAIKRKAWLEVGGFDADFFPVWFEDVDFCRRLRHQGWKIFYCPQAVFVHSGGHSVRKLDFGERQSYWYRNLLRYFAKHHSRWAVASLRMGIIAGLILRSVLSLVGARPPGVPLLHVLAAYWYVMREYAIAGRGWRLHPPPLEGTKPAERLKTTRLTSE